MECIPLTIHNTANGALRCTEITAGNMFSGVFWNRPSIAGVVVESEDAAGGIGRGNSALELVRQRGQQPLDLILRQNKGAPVGPVPDAGAAAPPRIG